MEVPADPWSWRPQVCSCEDDQRRVVHWGQSGHFYLAESGHFYLATTGQVRIMYIMLNYQCLDYSSDQVVGCAIGKARGTGTPLSRSLR